MVKRIFKCAVRKVIISLVSGAKFSKLFGFITLLLLLIAGSQSLHGQASSSDYEKIKLGEENSHFSGLDLSPDGKAIVFTEKHSPGFKICDWKSRSLTNESHSGAFSDGAKISYSKGGKYLLLQRLKYLGIIENKVRKSDFEIVEAATGKIIRLFEDVQAVVISVDEKYALCLSDGEVAIWNLSDVTKGKTFTIPGAANALAISPDGRIIAVSKSIAKEELESDTRYYKKKKALKIVVKYKQLVSLYDAQSFSLIKTISDPYDIIYDLKFSPDGNLILVFQNPHIKTQTSKKGITYINLIDINTKEPARLGFTSQTMNQPELKFSNDGKMFALNSKGNRFQEIHLYDFRDGTLLKRFELGYRLFGKSDGEKFIDDSHPSFTFLPGDHSILIAIGNRMVLWNLELNP